MFITRTSYKNKKINLIYLMKQKSHIFVKHHPKIMTYKNM
ncbi:hypothetical protein CLOSTHATH_02618 [Hungatella hathewayi DSM 13479]|uniref:Uncharacterized protein n=1 Tax=Hungatella hathewayi DSM 13479 TaxID=566550 RepID=D3AG83_9FIRM|nr:hypothetical protein CLOSTHATH_02618 [Hungatella hathewayi DSM 13479]